MDWCMLLMSLALLAGAGQVSGMAIIFTTDRSIE